MTDKQFKTLDDFLGTNFIYTYDNGWEYEWYAKNNYVDRTVEARGKYDTSPKLVVPEFAHITAIGDAGQDNEKVIAEGHHMKK